ncbi:probable E3 ubiquitin-protein ligase RHC1A [Andrographis paniculata]|uniref:probable E3 ubiquitin-protein ligase RHC1A n=1 Tax=Andrographis paniculata TaxID=175694 RepID=UPI0021E77555|nr:probable E3 ubiquitin-protein ligase RHC1A [Andrographis paniculata]XP_051151207.1 probable E3 ubiquitin-protein ligase RHC1A [Andrographis paniculata]
MSSHGRTHWCYRCSDTINLQTQTTVCPNCNGGFIQELEEQVAGNSPEPVHRPRFMEAVSNFLREQMTVRTNNTRLSEPSRPNGGSWNSFLVFTGDISPETRLPGRGGLLEFLNESLGFRRENGGDYFIGPGVEEFFDHVTRDTQNGAPPGAASRSSIDALPVVKIGKKHVRADTTCAVCKEKFELGSRVKKLPCKHLYHSECIVPWLEQRSSCPVCRHELSSRRKNSGNSSDRNRATMRWRRWSFRWLFRSTRASPRRQSDTDEPETVSYHEGDQYRENSFWPFEY